MHSPFYRKLRDSGLTAIVAGCALTGYGIFQIVSHKATTKNWTCLWIGVGLAVIGLIQLAIHLRKRGEKNRRRQLLRSNPEEPWLIREDWVNGEIEHNNLKLDGTYLMITLVFNAFGVILTWVAVSELRKSGDPKMLFLLLFPLIGLGLLVPIVMALLRAARFGKSHIFMEQTPAAIGKVMRGLVVTRVSRGSGAEAFRARLDCVNIMRIQQRDRNGRISYVEKKETLWTDERSFEPVVRHDDPRYLSVPVAFPIPSDCRPATVEDPKDRIAWMLTVKASIPGADYSSTYDLPVFQTADSPPSGNPVVDDGPLEACFDAVETGLERDDTQLGRGISMARHGDDAVEFRFSPSRKLAYVFSTGGCSCGFFLAGVAFAVLAPGAGFIAFLLFGLFALLLGWATVYTILTTTRLVASDQGVTVEQLGPFKQAPKTTAPEEIVKILICQGAKIGGIRYWALRLTTDDVMPVEIVNGLRDRAEAEWIAKTIAAAVGIPENLIEVGAGR